MLGVIHKTVVDLDAAVADTPLGKLRGFWADDVYEFRGIPYCTAKRFRLPEPVKPWEGVREALDYGYVCPLMTKEQPDATFFGPHRFWPMDEQCQSLNIWTASLQKDARKPVIVWFHGGGFQSGSSIEMYAYDGYRLAHDADVVIVTVNHRLNLLGYLDLSDFGEDYKYSGIAGMADLGEALKWVHENISAFGGDPDNVTIMGQSGGGAKVAALMQMPSADGLYHKAVIQSGVPNFMNDLDKADTTAYGRKLVEMLGLDLATIERIDRLPYEALVEAANKTGISMMFVPAPVPGYYEGTFRQAGFRPETAHIPMLVGSNISEFSINGPEGDKAQWSAEEKYVMLKERFCEDTDLVIRLFSEVYGDRDILNALSTDSMVRPATKDFCRARARAASAPVYNYLMTYDFPYKGGRQAWHCAEIAFIFRNARYDLATCTGGDDIVVLEDTMSRSRVSFARTGAPGRSTESTASFSSTGNAGTASSGEAGAASAPCHAGWKPVTDSTVNTYIFDRTCGPSVCDEDELMALLRKRPPVIRNMMGAHN